MTPVVLLTDGFLGNGAQPWKIPSLKDYPSITPRVAKEGDDYKPYARDPETLARMWALPGTKGLEHRIGGLEKVNVTGEISYVPENHQIMTVYVMLRWLRSLTVFLNRRFSEIKMVEMFLLLDGVVLTVTCTRSFVN